MVLTGKKILIAISGSIAAYKIILLTRLLVKAGATVKIVMTPSATQFVSPLVLSTLSKNPVLKEFMTEDSWANHVQLGRWADLMVVAPLSCNTLAKMASGICDNLVLAVYLSATCKVLCAPAMDADMWHHPSTQENISRIKAYGNQVLDVEAGELASGLVGEGRMAEPEVILNAIIANLRSTELKNRSILITAGPTQEAIDPVRFIANHSTGKMGVALAEAFYLRGATVTLIAGPGSVLPKFSEITIQSVVSAQQMYEAALEAFPNADIAVLAAAVADYTPVMAAPQKIKKKEATFPLELQKTKDILKKLGELKTGQLLIGFALETSNALSNARQKLIDKNADFIVLNSMEDTGAGFGYDTNQVTVLGRDGTSTESSLDSKAAIADFILDTVLH